MKTCFAGYIKIIPRCIIFRNIFNKICKKVGGGREHIEAIDPFPSFTGKRGSVSSFNVYIKKIPRCNIFRRIFNKKIKRGGATSMQKVPSFPLLPVETEEARGGGGVFYHSKLKLGGRMGGKSIKSTQSYVTFAYKIKM